MSEPGEQNLKHLDEMTCLLYLERQLDRARGLEVSAHTQECESCRTLLRALERESRLLTRAMLEDNEPLPSRLEQFQQAARRSMQWIWGLAFGLAATGVYALYTQYIEPWQEQLQQAGFSGTNLLGLLIFQSPFWKGWQSMITLFEILALATLGGLGVMFLRRRIRRGSALALVFAVLCAALMTTPAASGTEFRKADSVEVRQDEKVKGDLYITTQSARVDGTVDGDVIVFGQSVNINGHVMGDLIAFAQSVRINGEVDGNVRTFNNNITITGNVAKNVMTFGETVTIDSNAKVGGSATCFCESLGMDGTVSRDLLLFIAHANLNGKVGGAVRAKGDTLVIGSTAVIDGAVHFEGNKQPEVSSSAKLASPVEFKQLERRASYRTGRYYVWQVIWLAAFILFGLVLYSLMPKFSQEAVKSAEQYGAAAGLGVLVLFGVPIAAFIACITVVGLFIGVSTLLLWWASLYFAQVIVGTVVGQWLMGRTNEFWPVVGRMAVGVLIVRVSTTIPDVGAWVKFVAILWGIGAISLALFRRFQPVPATGVTVPPGAQPLPPTVGGPLPA